LLAVFGEMEADAIRARVRATRTHLLRSGRVVGGTVTYGWRSVPNPDGPGYVLAHHPDRIEYVRGMCDRVSHGHSIYSVVQWLDEVVAPLPSASQRRRKRPSWSYSTAERLIRNPILAGMTPLNPGNTTKVRGTEVLRDADGLPVVDESVGDCCTDRRQVGHAAFVAGVVMMVSYSMGVNFPRRAWRRRRW